MVTRRTILSAGLAGALACSALSAGEVTSGIPVGQRITSYTSTKCGGADDGVKTGESLCYTWRLGSRPVAFLFARNADGNLASLVKELDKTVAANSAKGLAAVVNFIGLKPEEVAKFGQEHGIKHVALTITDEVNAGKFKVAPEAAVTVMHYRGGKVAANHAFAAGKLDQASVNAVIASAGKILTGG